MEGVSMNFKKLLVPFTAMSFLLAGCFGPDPVTPVDKGWDKNVKNSMQQEYGIIIPYVDGLDDPNVTFQDNKVLKVDTFFDDFNEAKTFMQSYDTKLGNAGFEGDYTVKEEDNESIRGLYSHTTDKTIVVAEETISEQLWIDIDINSDAYGIAFSLIAYLSGDFASFPLDSLCELIKVLVNIKHIFRHLPPHQALIIESKVMFLVKSIITLSLSIHRIIMQCLILTLNH